jgi:hypothetical protein
MSLASSSTKSFNLYKSSFVLLVLLYAALLVIRPELGYGDEYAFLPTLQSGKHFPMYGEEFPYYDSAALGRFNPLAGQEYNLAALVSNTPLAYFSLNALMLVSFSLIFAVIIKRLLLDHPYLYAIPILLLLTPGFTLTFTKLLYVDKSALFYFSVFLLSFLVFQKAQKPIYFIAAIIGANAAIYTKETAFLAIGAFTFAHMLFTWRTADRRVRMLDSLLMVSALLYIGIYAIEILPHRMSVELNFTNSGWTVFIKNLLNYGLFSDPIVVLLLFPITAWRVYAVFVRGSEPGHPVHDPLLAAGTTYASAYFILNMYSPYYFLPVYLFALPPIFYFLARDRLKNFAWKSAVVATALVLLVNAIPLSIHYLAYNKYVPVNFNHTLDFLVQDINKRYTDQRLAIFFDGVDRGTGRGVYYVVGEFLRFKGLSIDKFDFKSRNEALDPSPFIGHRSPFDKDEDIERMNVRYRFTYPKFPFTVFQPGPLPEIHKGDYLVVSPQSTANIDAAYLERLMKDYDLVFKTDSPFAIPRVTLKTLMKYLIIQVVPTEQRSKGMIVSENLWNWPNYYVFVKK